MRQPRFEVVLCDTEAARNLHYQIRYQVFCRETGFEDPGGLNKGIEKDSHDKNSVHFAVRDPVNDQWMAAIRLVLAGRGRIPSEKFCNIEPLPENLLERSSMVEFSRLCITETHRRNNRDRSMSLRVVDGKSGEVKLTRPDRSYPEIMLSLLIATAAWARSNDVRYCYFLINRGLARTLNRLGVDLRPVGDEWEHRGIRKPYISDFEQAQVKVSSKLPFVGEAIESGSSYLLYSDLIKNVSKSRAVSKIFG